MKRYVIKVTGKVQGVLFRGTARQMATELGLNGFARNEPDGSVYIEVEGDEAALRKFLKWCAEGSQYAEVDNVEYSEQKSTGHAYFEVR